MEKRIQINSDEYEIIRLLGKGKGGYSYLVTDGKKSYVLKQIHHEPCSYYTFGNKLQAELRDYSTLSSLGLPLPKLISVDEKEERILKEYIDGPTIFDLVLNDKMKQEYFYQIKQMCSILYPAKINIDYFPTNFVVQENKLYYIDYECNGYMEEWSFENWGSKYWEKTEEFMKYVNEHKS